MNIQGGITNAEKLIAIQDIVSKHTPDAIAISEAGKHCDANDLKWLNKSMDDHSGDNEHAYLNAMQADFPYTIHSKHTTAQNMKEVELYSSYIINGYTKWWGNPP